MDLKPRKLRLVTGTVAQVEEQLNKFIEDYSLQSLTFTVVGTELICTAMLIHESEIRKAQMMMTPPGFGRAQ